jgi:hypothetical protein
VYKIGLEFRVEAIAEAFSRRSTEDALRFLDAPESKFIDMHGYCRILGLIARVHPEAALAVIGEHCRGRGWQNLAQAYIAVATLAAF